MSEMTLTNVRRGVRPAPDRILMVGTEGVGKSTFASCAPKPIFIAPEDGVRHLDVASFPEPKTYEDVVFALLVLAIEDHEYETVVIDTVDWLEPLILQAACDRNGWPDIEKPGYGKGYVAALAIWRELLADLERIRKRGLEVILLAHAHIKNFSNPAGDDYSRYECKLQVKAGALVKEWTDANLFATHEEFVADKDGKKKGVSTGKRIIHTERTAAWDAKNRHNLPPTLDLSYAAYAAAREAGRPKNADELRVEADTLIAELAPEPEFEQKIRAVLADDARCQVAVNRLRQLISERGAA